MFKEGDNYCYTDIALTKQLINSMYGIPKQSGIYPWNHCIPTIKKVIFNNPATIVFWEDGTKTVVKCQEGDTYNPETGLAMAISKKALGNKGNYANEFKKWLPKDEESPKNAVVTYMREFGAKLSDAINAGLNDRKFVSYIKENKYGEKYDSLLFYAGRKHKVVCAGDCYHVKNIKKENRLVYTSIQDAIGDGCRLCKHCHGAHKEVK